MLKSKLLSIVVCLVLVSGCAIKSTYHLSQTHIENFEDVATLILKVELDREKICLVDTRPNPSERLAVAQAASNAAVSGIQSAPVPPDAGPGAAVGMIIGMQIVKASQDAKEQAEANRKAKPILEIFSQDRLAEMLYSDILEVTDSQEKIAFVQPPSATPNSLLLEPELHFNSDLSRVEVKLNATVYDMKSKKVLYQNTFEYWSTPTGIINNSEQSCALWVAEDGALLTAYIKEGAREVIDMLLYDIEASVLQDRQDVQRTHRITSDRGTVFQRGTAVKIGDNRVWVKDLRGNLRSISGQLEAGRVAGRIE